MEFSKEQIIARLNFIKGQMAQQYHYVDGRQEPIENNKIEIYQREILEIEKLFPDLESGEN